MHDSVRRDVDQLGELLDAVSAVESELDLPAALRQVVEMARAVTGARYGALGVLGPTGKGLAQFVYSGIDEVTAAAIGRLPAGEGLLGALVVDPAPLRLADRRSHPDAAGLPPGHPDMRTFLGAPLRVRDAVHGNLYVAEKAGGEPFGEDDEMLVMALATAAGIAVDRARLQSRVGELSLAADRERIARDLHDTVIQRLFATGLSLQSSLGSAGDAELRRRVEESIGDLDETIRQVRGTIFVLEQVERPAAGLRARLLAVCAEASASLGFDPEVRFAGPIDAGVGEAIVPEILASLREALSDVARHAGARGAGVELLLGQDVVLRVRADGRRPEHPPRPGGTGVASMAARAARLGGSCTVVARPEGCTVVTWKVPLRP